MENWMQKFEDMEDKTYETILNRKLEKLIDLADGTKVEKEEDMIRLLMGILEIYEKLEKSGYDLDKKDMIFRKKSLAELRYKKMKKEHIESQEAESWKEFEENEKQEDMEDEER